MPLTNRNQTEQETKKRKRRGATLVIVAIMFTVLVSFVAMALDFSRMYLFKAELQTLADAAAMSAILDQRNGLTETQAETNAFVLKSANHVEGSGVATMDAADIGPATWNFTTRVQGSAGSWSSGNAVQVTVRYTANWTLGRIFGGTNRALTRVALAAGGSLSTSSCLKPWAIPYASILQKLGKSTPYDVNYALTQQDILDLDNSTTETAFLEKDPPGGNLPGNFGWIDVSVTGTGNKNNQIAQAIGGCVSSGLGAGSTIAGIPGVRSANVIQTALEDLCNPTSTTGNGANTVYYCNSSVSPQLVPIYDTGAGSGNNTTFHIKYIGAFKLTRLDKDGLWGYLTSINTSPSGTLTSTPGPVGSMMLVK